MKRAKLWLLVVCVAFLAGLLMLALLGPLAKQAAQPVPLPTADVPPQSGQAAAPLPPAPNRPALAPPMEGSADTFGHPEAMSFGTAAIPPEREAAVLLDFLQVYRREFGAFPTGNENAHFVNALAGVNPASLVIFPIRHPRVSADGELLDAWGVPFHFHLIDRHHLEVRSAGPDGELFTADDIVAGARR